MSVCKPRIKLCNLTGLSLWVGIFSFNAAVAAEPVSLSQQAQQTRQTQQPQPLAQPPTGYAVASAHPLATQAGMEILAKGGNAFDAAVTVAAVLGVVEPYSAGIGGGGFWMLYQADTHRTVMLDARERAPRAATADLYLRDGAVDRDLATNTALAAGIPGQPAAFAHLAEHYGKLPLTATLQPAIDLAETGFPVNPVYRELARWRADVLRRYPESEQIFLPEGVFAATGDAAPVRIKQPDLAATLEQLATNGRAGFYAGNLARQLVKGVRAQGGNWVLDDLKTYTVVEREPIRFRYKDAIIWSAAPPSSGGIALAEMFGMLESLPATVPGSVDRTHQLVEVMRRAYRDRAEYLGDPDYVDIPVKRLLDSTYLDNLIEDFNPTKATPSSSLDPALTAHSGTHTTHLSVMDAAGNRVSATLSINLPFGSGVTVAGTGVLLNNEMDDFSAQPGSPNAYGLVGSTANAIAPGKRPLSSMTPTFMEFGPLEQRRVIAIGTPGGSRIITMVMLGLLAALDGQPPHQWVSRPRFHHQYLPDVIQHEPDALPPAQARELQAMGHQLENVGRTYGDMHVVIHNLSTGGVDAASDPRRLGTAATK